MIRSVMKSQIIQNISSTLSALGEDIHRKGLQQTPARYAKSMEFLTSGYQSNVDAIVGDAIYDEAFQEMVVVRDIEFFSLCEHHLLPFTGKAHVGYIPNGKVIGLSKIPRIVNVFSRRLQLQERLTRQIANELMRILNPQGVAVRLEASHFCMMMRGVEKQSSTTVTQTMLGCFEKDPNHRQEFLSSLKS